MTIQYEENGTAALDTYTADDPENQDVDWTPRGLDAGLFQISSSGELAFKLPPDHEMPGDFGGNNVYNVTVRATDRPPTGTPLWGTHPVTVTVTDVDERPTIDGPANVDYAEGGTGNVATYRAVDPEGATIIWTLAGAQGGKFTITNGVLRFRETPDYEEASSYQLTVIASDGNPLIVARQDVTVDITNLEEAGTLTLSSEQPSIGVPFTATLADPDGVRSSMWEWRRADSRSAAGVVIAGATGETYTPTGDDRDKYLRVKVVYTDGHGAGKEKEAVSKFATQPDRTTNTAPSFPANPDSLSVREDARGSDAVGDPVVATDEEHDPITYSLTVSGAPVDPPFTIDRISGQIRVAAGVALDHETRPSHSVTVRATDSFNAEGSTTVTIEVTNVNEAPTIDGSENVDYAENRDDAVASYTADDPENQDVDWTKAGPDRDLFEISSSGVLAFQSPPDYEMKRDSGRNNVYNVTVRATDRPPTGTPLTGTLPVTVTVRDVNEVPEFPSTEDGMRNVPENTPTGRNVGTPVAAVARDNDTLTYSITSGANLFDINPATGQLLTKAALDRETAPSHTIRVGVSDGKDANGHVDTTVDDTITVTVTVVDVDEAPKVMGPEAVTKAENSGRSVGRYTATDPEGEDVTWTTLTGADARHFAFDNGALSFVSEPDFEARPDNTYEVTVRARDEGGHIGELRVTVTVRDVNEVPEFPSTEDGMRSVPENTPARRTFGDPVAAVAGDNDTLTYSITSGANLFGINPATGQLLTKAALDRETAPSHTIRVGVSDGKDANNMAEDPPVVDNTISVEIAVEDVDEAPKVMGPEAVTKAENSGTSVGAYTAADPEIKAVTWETLRGADAGHFAFDDGALSFVSEPDFEARRDNTYEVTVRARDEGGKIGELPVTVTLINVNERPTITGAAEASIEEEGTLFVDAYTASDPESATIAWQPLAGSDADKFEFNPSNGWLAFKVAPDFEDADRGGDNEYDVTLTVSAGGHTITFDVAVTVTNKEEPGMLTLPKTQQPQADADYTATLSDPDGVQSTTWTWERSRNRSGPWTAVSGSADRTTTSVYTPVTGDVDYYLRATAEYTDALSPPGKSLVAVSTNSVRAKPVINNPPAFTETNPTRSVAENARANALVGGRVTATDPDPGNTVRYEFASAGVGPLHDRRQQRPDPGQDTGVARLRRSGEPDA